MIVNVFAQEIKKSQESNQLQEQMQNLDDVDEQLLNSRLRASTGSKSKYSIQTELNYSGGSVFKPFGPTRPRLAPGPIVETSTKMTGDISFKYRISDSSHLNFGSGLGVTRPGFSNSQFQIENPFAAFTEVGQWNDIQIVGSFSFLKYSSKEIVEEEKIWGQVGAYLTFLWALPGAKIDTGFTLYTSRELYSELVESNSFGSLTYLSLNPFLEYNLDANFSIRTVYRGIGYYSLRENEERFYWDEPTQSLGFGLTVFRDFYLYPNIQWAWRSMQSDKTTLGLSLNYNIF